MSELDDDDASPELVTRSEVLRRRSRRLKRLSEIYSDYYWALIEDLKSKHRQFYWNNNNNNNNSINNNNNYNNNIDDNDMCRTNGCKSKAMALTRFCITHILSDPKQVLYKPCNYPLKSSPSGPIICMKPIARSLVPSLCPQHLEKAEKSLRIALKKNSYANATTASKIAPKINVLVAESIRQIQSKRRAAKKDLRVDTTTTKYKTSDC